MNGENGEKLTREEFSIRLERICLIFLKLIQYECIIKKK